MAFKLKKYEGNPILKANPENPWESLCVLNPAAIYDEKRKKVMMLYRAAGDDITHYIRLGLAESDDGFNFRRCFDSPVLSPDYNGADGGCIEDPRVVKMNDTYYVTYACRAFPPGRYWGDNWIFFGTAPEDAPSFMKTNTSQTYLAYSKDLVNFRKCGRMTDSRIDDRDVVIFPEKVNGHYVRLSRPVQFVGEKYGCSIPSIFINYSDDLVEWDESQTKLLMTGEQWWESKKLGASCPPIRTKYGWLHIYHAVAIEDDIYRVGAVLLDIDNPSKILCRTKDFIMEPEYEYETSGYYNGCVFPTGNVVLNDTLFVYYGAADKYCCVATCNINEFLDYLMTECRL